MQCVCRFVRQYLWLTCMRPKLQVYPIASVEIEISPWSYEEETEKGEQILNY